MTQQGTIEGTVAQFEAWMTASERRSQDPGAALADLFARARRGDADLHDPTPALLSWLIRDLARDDTVAAEDYEHAVATLAHYLVFLRAHQLWRRSERAVQECWDVIGWAAAQQPLGLTTLGGLVDETIADQLRTRPSPTELVTRGVRSGYAGPLQATLNALARQGSLSRSEIADVAGLEPDSVAHEIWVGALLDAELAHGDDTLAPTAEVTETGGCPPPSSMFMHRVVRSLARAAVLRALVADAEAGLALLPRAMGVLVALVASTDVAYYAADGEDDEEAGTTDLAEMFVAQAAPDATSEQRAMFEGEVLAALEALTGFGLLETTTLERGASAALAPEPFRYPIVEAVSGLSGVVGTSDESAAWQPVELPFSLAADTAVDLMVMFEHDPQIWRRLRVLGTQTLEQVHRTLQIGLGWRDVRAHLFATADGTHRFAPQWLLGSLQGDEDAAVTDSGPVRVGSMLRGGGDELVYLYGTLRNPWRLRLRVERVMSGVKDPVAWLDGAGEAPAEPSRIGAVLQSRLPEGWSLPHELERAWVFMERQGWVLAAGDGTELAAPGPPEARPGLVFSSGLGLADRWGAGHPALQRVVPIAASPDDTRVALWLDDDGVTRVVALTPDGGASLLGDGAVDLLRLAAVGYPAISPQVLGRPPEDEAAVAGVAEFRRWVLNQLGVDVPPMWGPLGSDRFTEWLARQGGHG
ncbi:IS1096 element passenger TnpR family protein [Pseudactinotalea sp.]|uniref:IS1096 element passenger TnpR family protein n=1 Tax=Pseudactinotalea sp. TaxID=1926260 RepID=UPI003B3B0756